MFDVENGNPNGDPDAGNCPGSIRKADMGLSQMCVQNVKIRNYVEAVKEDEERVQGLH